jgi:hypothetical protein
MEHVKSGFASRLEIIVYLTHKNNKDKRLSTFRAGHPGWREEMRRYCHVNLLTDMLHKLTGS